MARTSLTNRLGFLVYDVARMFRADFRVRAQQLPLTEGQWRVLAQLARMEGCRQTDLAEILEIRPISLTRQIDKLVDHGLVERHPHPSDRRAALLHLTASATPLIEQLLELGVQTRERALAGFDADERRQLLAYLERIRANLSTATEADSSHAD
jgi:DNA-binding MarR family transcriptional regulator